MAIAAAVPQLMVNAGNSMSTSNLPTAHTATSQSSASNMDKLSSTASQENLINVESTVMSSSTSRIVSTAYYDESGEFIHLFIHLMHRLASTASNRKVAKIQLEISFEFKNLDDWSPQ